MPSAQEDAEKLEYAARLSGLLLNEGTDVMRWFLMDNLPRRIDEKPDLAQLLAVNQKSFQSLLQTVDENFDEQYFGHEMFDLLYPSYDVEIDEENMEISLIFILIRFLCKIKHATWKWWDEEPQVHQTAPLFDIIRLFRFKVRMQNIVHKYEINKESFDASLAYATKIIERLRGFKMSARRWKQDVITYEENESVTKKRKTLDLVAVMRWQTLPMEQRNATYLVMKRNFNDKISKFQDTGDAWKDFISCFGQMKNLDVSRINDIEQCGEDKRVLTHKANDVSHRDYLKISESPAKILHWHLVHDKQWKEMINGDHSHQIDGISLSGINETDKNKNKTKLTTTEKSIYSSIDDRIYIPDLKPESTFTTSLREGWKRKVINSFKYILSFPWKERCKRKMDNVRIRVRLGDSRKHETLNNWTNMFPNSNKDPVRILLRGIRSYGKSTTLHKIAYECATRNSPRLQNYDLIFYIDLTKIQLEKPYTRISDCIKVLCLDDEGSELHVDDIENLFNTRNGRGVLFLMDNADCLKMCDETSEIIDVIKGNQWSECGIVLTATDYAYKSDDTFPGCISESRVSWQIFHVVGFTSNDVVEESGRLFKSRKTNTGAISAARHVTNLIRINQRDIYDGEGSSPLLVSILLEGWMSLSEYLGERQTIWMPETTSKIMENLFSRYFSSYRTDQLTEFETEVREETLLNETSFFTLHYPQDQQVNSLLRSGILLVAEENENKSTVFFSHKLLQDYFSARVFCDSLPISEITKYANKISDVIRLRNFLLFCCEILSEAAESILDTLCELAASTEKRIDQDTFILNLCMQCVYVSSISYQSSGYRSLTSSFENQNDIENNNEVNTYFKEDYENSDLITASLKILDPHKLTSRTKQSILKFTSTCRPPLTRSGTVFPLLTGVTNIRTTAFIKRLHISGIKTNQVIFVSAVIRNLPFLYDITLTGIEAITENDFRTICSGLQSISQNMLSPLHSLTFIFKCATHFDRIQVPTYEALRPVLENFQFLESFNIEPLSYQHFLSFYPNTKCLIPIKNINLCGSNITENRCHFFSQHLARSPFLDSLNLSHNPLYGGLKYFQEPFNEFRCLQELQLGQCCLSPTSLAALTVCVKSSRLERTLTSLNLRANHIDHQVSLLSFAESLGHLKALQKLDLSQNFLRNRVVCVFSSHLRNLRRLRDLRLDYVEMGEAGFSALRCNISYLLQLEVLSVGENLLGCDALNYIADLQGTNVRETLIELNLSGISCEVSSTLTGKEIRKVVESLKQFQKLKVLDLRNTEIKYSDAITILRAAEDHKTLNEVRLSDKLTLLNDVERKTWSCLKIV
ncbi:uncharacterized protein LOC120347917 [Styela clava]